MEWIIDFIAQYGMIAMFLFIACEYACLPLPSEVVLPLSGAMAVSGGRPLLLVIFISVVAGLLGSMICYSIGYSGGSRVLELMKHRYPSTKRGIESTQHFYKKYATFSVAIGRVIPLFRTYISFMAGITKQSVTTFILASSIGIFAWNSLLITLGYVLADRWREVMGYYDKGKWFILLGFFLIIGGIALKKVHERKKMKYPL